MRHIVAITILFVSHSFMNGQSRPAEPPAAAGLQPPRRLPALQNVTDITPPVAKPQTGAVVDKMVIPPSKDNLITFDHRFAQVRWIEGRWELHAGNTWLKDFGNREWDARQALDLIRRLKLTQRGTIGSPAPIMEYWLSEGEAPKLQGYGYRVRPIDLRTLRAEKINGQWCVRDQRRLLFNFGSQQQYAQQALGVIRRYGFTHVGFIGSPKTKMIYFLSDPAKLKALNSMSALPIMPGDASAAANSADAVNPRREQGPSNQQSQLSPFLLQQVKYLAKGLHQLSPPPIGPVTHVPFDPAQAKLRSVDNAWKIYAGNYVIADFGTDLAQARQALDLLKSYRCNEHCLIGQPTPSFSYFLVQGQAPRGVHHGLKGQRFQPLHLNLKQVNNEWYIYDGKRPLLYFGDRKADAEHLLQAIRRHRFDYISQIGPEGRPAMTVLVRSF